MFPFELVLKAAGTVLLFVSTGVWTAKNKRVGKERLRRAACVTVEYAPIHSARFYGESRLCLFGRSILLLCAEDILTGTPKRLGYLSHIRLSGIASRLQNII